MRAHLLLLAANLEDQLDRLANRCVVHRCYAAPEAEALLAEVGPEIRIVATNGHVGCSAELLARLPRLELIGCFGVCLLYTSPSPRDATLSRMPSSA